jgi:hypothetical protein
VWKVSHVFNIISVVESQQLINKKLYEKKKIYCTSHIILFIKIILLFFIFLSILITSFNIRFIEDLIS